MPIRYAFVGLLIGLISCDLDDNPSPDPNLTAQQNVQPESLVTHLTSSQEVQVAVFVEDGRDKTGRFTGFTFNFQPDGTVVATRGEESISGTFRVFRDDAKVELSMQFPARSLFDELSDDWYFISKGENRLTFDDEGDRLVLMF